MLKSSLVKSSLCKRVRIKLVWKKYRLLYLVIENPLLDKELRMMVLKRASFIKAVVAAWEAYRKNASFFLIVSVIGFGVYSLLLAIIVGDIYLFSHPRPLSFFLSVSFGCSRKSIDISFCSIVYISITEKLLLGNHSLLYHQATLYIFSLLVCAIFFSVY